MEKRYAAAARSLALVALLAACTTSSASQEEQMEYLREMAQRGAEFGDKRAVHLGSGDPICEEEFDNLYSRGRDMPHIENHDEEIALLYRAKSLFVDSCWSETPMPVPPLSKSPSPSSLPASPATKRS